VRSHAGDASSSASAAIVIGPREGVFHSLPKLETYEVGDILDVDRLDRGARAGERE
jgi:hypothetical protein